MTQEYSVTQCLPDNNQKVLCFGHHTHCCKEDMDENPDWHEVTFELDFYFYKLKKEIPTDPDESIIESSRIIESWTCGPEFTDGKVIGVTKWKELPKE